jgi:hypothetical protein
MRAGAPDEGLGHRIIHKKNVEKPILDTIRAPAVGALAFHMMEGLQ